MATPGFAQTRGFLFADLRDYTRFVETRGDLAAVELLAAYRSLVREVVARFGGAEIRTEGDSFYIVFLSASSAVQCGLAIEETAGQRTISGEPLRIGIGIHAGETAETDEGLVGSAVNVAARIAAQAGAGEVLVSDTVRSLTRTLIPVRFVPRGRPRLKGVTEPIELYRAEPMTGDVTAIGNLRSRGRRMRLPGLASAAVGLVVLGALGVTLFLGQAGPLPTAGSQASLGGASSLAGSPSPSPSTAPDLASADLLARVLPSLRDFCQTDPQGPTSAKARVRCVLPAGTAGVNTVWLQEFDTSQALGNQYLAYTDRINAPPGDCGSKTTADGPWPHIGAQLGHLLCYGDSGKSWLIWTYDARNILAIAVRNDDDSRKLYLWWGGEGNLVLEP